MSIHTIAIGVIGALAATSVSVSAAPVPGAIQLQECRLESSTARGGASARCGSYEVPEDRRAGNGKHIRIHVAVIPALRREALPDPVFILSGGPGQAASDFYLSSSHAFEQLRRDRDLVVIDQRGTGQSQRLDCKLPDELETERFDPEIIRRYTRECLGKLNGDPRFYTTSVAVADLDEIRVALGYRKINLYGISYGTRVAQHYLRRYPDQVRSVVLDGVVPVEVALGPEIAPAAQSALDAILDRCNTQSECNHAFPEIKTELGQLRARLEHGAIPIVVPDPRTAQSTRINFSYMHLATALRLHSYSDDTASLLPYSIHEAASDRPQSMAAQALLVATDLGEQIANGMHNAVVCTEDVPFIAPETLRDPAIDRSYLKHYFIESLQAMCSVWPRGELDEDFHAPLSTTIAALLLSGENDPVTPVSFGERAASAFKNGRHVVVTGKGHGQLNNPCVARVITHFIERGSARDLDLSCIAKQGAAPFMLTATGPAP